MIRLCVFYYSHNTLLAWFLLVTLSWVLIPSYRFVRSSSFSSPPSLQAQLIHDRNTASHGMLNDKAESGPERVHMTWTKDKLFTERSRNRECNANMAVRDLFNMKP